MKNWPCQAHSEYLLPVYLLSTLAHKLIRIVRIMMLILYLMCLVHPMMFKLASWMEQTCLNHPLAFNIPMTIPVIHHHLCHFNQKLNKFSHLSHPQIIIHLLMVWLNDIFLLTGVDIYTIIALPCEVDGTPLLDPEMPPIIPHQQSDNWMLYKNHITFELADFLYRCEQMLAGNADILLELWAASLACHNNSPPFSDHQNLYNMINA